MDNEEPKPPEKITLDNAFVEPETWKDATEEKPNGFLNKWSRQMFFPTKKEFADQCFNMDSLFSAFILVRLIYYRDNTPSQLLKNVEGTDYSNYDTYYSLDEEGQKKHEEQMNKNSALELAELNRMIEGFWIAINCDVMYRDEDDEMFVKVKNARYMLAKYWDCLWF